LLAAHERPDFINLHTLGRHVADRGVLILGARVANTCQQAKNRAFRDASQADGRAHRTALDQRRDDRDLFRCGESIHDGSIILYRFSMSSGKRQIQREILGGGLLVLFRPASAGTLFSHVAALFGRHRFKASLSADPSALSAHFCHYLRNEVRVGSWGFWFDVPNDGFEDDTAGVLNGIKLRLALANAFRHVSTVARLRPFRQAEAISN
jgi:hypothetical protein